jgi:hypothetical protein
MVGVSERWASLGTEIALKIRLYWNDVDYDTNTELERDILLGICEDNTFYEDYFMPPCLQEDEQDCFVCGILYRNGLSTTDTNHYFEFLEE